MPPVICWMMGSFGPFSSMFQHFWFQCAVRTGPGMTHSRIKVQRMWALHPIDKSGSSGVIFHFPIDFVWVFWWADQGQVTGTSQMWQVSMARSSTERQSLKRPSGSLSKSDDSLERLAWWWSVNCKNKAFRAWTRRSFLVISNSVGCIRMFDENLVPLYHHLCILILLYTKN